MNEAAAVAQQTVGSTGLEDLLALVGFPSQRRSAGKLSTDAGEILKGINSFIDGLLLRTIAAQSKSEFVEARAFSFPPYAMAVTSLARLMKVVVPPLVIERVLDESFCEIEADFRDQGLARFGITAKDQAIFTVCTLRRTSRLISKIASIGATAENLKEQDQKLAENFGFYTTWAQFHLDCLLVAIREDRQIQFTVLPEIIDGLRAAVDAFGYASEGLDLRVPREEPHVQSYEWDEEDQMLLSSSMHEMETQILDDLSWSEQEANALNARRPSAVVVDKSKTIARSPESSPAFGTHIREAIDIIKDWIEHPSPKE